MTTISDTLYLPNGLTYSGLVTIYFAGATNQPAYTAAGRTLTGFAKAVRVTDGTISVDLEANDTITPAGTSYQVRCQPSSGTPWTESWVVPTSISPVTVGDVRVATAPTPTVLISHSQINPRVTDSAGRLLSLNSTPTSSADSVTPGAVWFDANYIYVCTAAGTIKRAALSSF